MSFQITALPREIFEPFFKMSNADLVVHGARRIVVSESPGSPCRVSLADAAVGESVLLVNYCHQTADTPYRATHAIFVREDAHEVRPEVGEVPAVISTRLISARVFDAEHMMIDAEVVEGHRLKARLEDVFADPKVSYVHLHNAKPGCFAAAVSRA